MQKQTKIFWAEVAQSVVRDPDREHHSQRKDYVCAKNDRGVSRAPAGGWLVAIGWAALILLTLEALL